ncbi:hypothetical protein C6P45_004851 [Maudiozyma exigua]|uniref:RING-type E3 ubiquitin transferase (cysteine targeting) n=1 Tax=Maudiozyma exigua TaxID=34358 RepID=A0A9P6W9S3_MAUEX|nr:hypothetical protein C6P45_004851 [Kazachstania exigua]
MSRVSQLDSNILDSELHNLLYRDLNNVFTTTIDNEDASNNRNEINIQNTDEWHLLCDTLIYLFTAHKSTNTNLLNKSSIETYGTNLNGLTYKSPLKISLYLSTVLSKYLLSKFDKNVLLLLFSNSNSNLNSTRLNLVMHFSRIIISIAKLLNFTNFIVTGNFISLLNRLLNLKMVNNRKINSSNQFSQQNRLGSMDIQNRQLLWNAVLELLNVTILLPNSRFLFNSWQNKTFKRKIDNNNNTYDDDMCPYCNEPVSNPYIISCCNKKYCYWCVCKILEWKHCSNCNKTGSLQAKPLYH